MLFLYLIVFLAKDYWEAEPDKKESMRGLIKGFNLKKGKNRVLIELVALLIFFWNLESDVGQCHNESAAYVVSLGS